MIKLNKILEGKQVGMLYHFLTLYSLEMILSENELRPYKNSDDGISFTRDKNFVFRKHDEGISNQCCLVIDGNELSENYKIVPFDFDFNNKYNGGMALPVGDEMEERVFGKNKKIKNIREYIIKIILFKKQLSRLAVYTQPTIGNIKLLDKNVDDDTIETSKNAPRKIKMYIEKKYNIPVEIK